MLFYLALPPHKYGTAETELSDSSQRSKTVALYSEECDRNPVTNSKHKDL
jgi:hypothetical protein